MYGLDRILATGYERKKSCIVERKERPSQQPGKQVVRLPSYYSTIPKERLTTCSAIFEVVRRVEASEHNVRTQVRGGTCHTCWCVLATLVRCTSPIPNPKHAQKKTPASESDSISRHARSPDWHFSQDHGLERRTNDLSKLAGLTAAGLWRASLVSLRRDA